MSAATVPPIGANSARRLERAVDRASGLIASGTSPDEALAKAARDAGLPRNHIPIAARSLNISLVNEQRLGGRSPAEKAAAVSLVDAERTMQLAFPEKAASSPPPASPDYTTRASSWHDPLSGYRAPVVFEKAAACSPPPDPYRTAKRAHDDAVRRRSELRRDLVVLRRQAARDDLAAKLAAAALGEEARLSGVTPVQLQADAGLYYGDLGRAVAVEAARYPNRLKFAASPDPRPVAWGFAESGPGAVLADAVTRAGAYLETLGRIKAASDEVDALDEALDSPYTNTPGRPKTVPEFLRRRAKAANLTGSLLGASALSNTIKNVGSSMASPGKDNEAEIRKHMAALDDPGHEMALRSINVRAMLADLLQNDPVISGYDPSEVAAAFNEVSSSAPNLAMQSLYMRPMLRKALQQGQVDTFQGKEVLDTERMLGRSPESPQPMRAEPGSMA